MSNGAGDPLCQSGSSLGHIKELQNPRCPAVHKFQTATNLHELPNSLSSLKTSQMTIDSMCHSNITHINNELRSIKQSYLNPTNFSNSFNDDFSVKASSSKISHNLISEQNSHAKFSNSPQDYNHHIDLNNSSHVNQQYTNSYSHSQQCKPNHYVPRLKQDYDGIEGSQNVINNSVTVKLKPYTRKCKSHVTQSGSLALNTLPYPPTVSYHQGNTNTDVQGHSVYQKYQRHDRPTSPTCSRTPSQKVLIHPKELPVFLIPTPVLKHKHLSLK